MRLATFLVSATLLVACKDDVDPASIDGALDASSRVDSSQPDAGSDCYASPTRYLEIINACTDADKIAKDPALPLLGPDGKLPALP
jgi:hypothetical protein